MNADDIAALCAAMSLKELEEPVRKLEGDLKNDGERKLSLCLVGKVLANKLIHRDVFQRVLLRIWKFLKVHVVINVLIPLRRILRLDVLGDGDESVMLLWYERLPEHCHRCGRLRHRTIECTDSEANQELLFGAWLKAGVPIIRKNRRPQCPYSVEADYSDKFKISHNGKKLKGVDKNVEDTHNNHTFLFSSQHIDEQARNKQKVRDKGLKKQMGHQGFVVNEADGLDPNLGSAICLFEGKKDSATDGPSIRENGALSFVGKASDCDSNDFKFGRGLDVGHEVGSSVQISDGIEILASEAWFFGQTDGEQCWSEWGYMPHFTRSNERDDDQLIQERLDRGLGCFWWSQLFPFSCVKHFDFWRSDHRPLLVEVSNSRKCHERACLNRRFHFEACWAEDEGRRLLIELNWGIRLYGGTVGEENTIAGLQCLNKGDFVEMIYGQIRPTRGLHQGDPISPYIFLICAEGLSSMLKQQLKESAFRVSSVSRKDTGSLGFRDMLTFNQALLPKKVIWNGLLWGKDILVTGSRWRIGDVNFMECFRSANSGEDQVLIGGRSDNINWCKPDQGWFKVNTEVVVDNLKCGVCVGIIIMNHLGVVRCCSIRNFRANFSPQIAEAIALLYGIRLAVEENFVPAVIEFDAKAVGGYDKYGSCTCY
ncbi:hypothetical protein Ddye_008003 [Dipteronia dyeriana]|uniref:RNase H type-1 domain-containing protein n=1 Tax=Dipteronia dyeriana TaxID=168575 RepID=A0AAD9X932_9ROSI|nr:hypothetical protein Ddye_008003 [Dipteronia dyeriana]